MTMGDETTTVREGRLGRLAGDLETEEFDRNIADPLDRRAVGRSFALFMLSPVPRQQTHWVPESLCRMYNSAFPDSSDIYAMNRPFGEICGLFSIHDTSDRKVNQASDG